MPSSPAKTKKKQGFKPGQSGNPSGRPHGSRNKATLALEALLDDEGEAITRKAIEKALEGDTAALRLVVVRRRTDAGRLYCLKAKGYGRCLYRLPLR